MSNSLEARDSRITARLSTQGAMLEELKAVLPQLNPETARSDARRVIVEENRLARPSLKSREKVFQKLSTRYFRAETSKAVERFIRYLKACENPLQFQFLCYTMLLWNDGLVFELGNNWLAPRLNGPVFEAETQDVERELERLSDIHPPIRQWQPYTRRKVATKYLGLLRDCGYATGVATKRLLRPFIPPEAVLFGAQLVIGGGDPASRMPEHPLFTAMGLSLEEVVDALSDLRAQRRIDFQIQGGMSRWKVLTEGIEA